VTRPAWASGASRAGFVPLSVLMLLIGGLTMPTALAAAAPTTALTAVGEVSACTTSLPAADAALTERPVVLVHGWNSNAAAMEGLAKLISKGTQHYFLYCFDYSHLTPKWPKDPSIHQQLANEIVALSMAYKRGGGDGKVLAVGHSMGGIAIRYASQDTFAGVKVGDILAGVVTLGTPHIGSPWGGAGVARALEVAAAKYNGDRLFPPANSDAAACLATLSRRPESCGQIPYLPPGVPLTELGTQIFVHRTLFNIGFVKGPSADIALFGDGLVPQDSSTGYIGSGPQIKGSRRIPYRATVTPDVATCTYDTDYLLAAKAGAKVAGSGQWAVAGALAGVLGNEILDSNAADRLLQSKASPFLAQLTAYAATTPCFHTNLTTLPKLADATITALASYSTPAKTKQVGVRPVDGGGNLVTGYVAPLHGGTIDGETYSLGRVPAGITTGATCNGGSGAVSGAYRCFADNSVYDPCWFVTVGEVSGPFVICRPDPFSSQLFELLPSTVDGPLAGQGGGDPWGVRLNTGVTCLLLQGARNSFGGRDVEYGCSDDTVLLHGLDRTHSLWHADSAKELGGQYTALGAVTITTAYRGDATAPSR
jgi:pimeloyl-ACP methyl ester carboxylesterase